MLPFPFFLFNILMNIQNDMFSYISHILNLGCFFPSSVPFSGSCILLSLGFSLPILKILSDEFFHNSFKKLSEKKLTLKIIIISIMVL